MNSEAHRGRYKGWEGSESPLGSLGCGSPRDFLASLWREQGTRDFLSQPAGSRAPSVHF